MEYAVIKTGGKQYRVSVGDTLEVAKLEGDKESAVTFENVLLWVLDSQVKIGKPMLTDVKVKAKILEQKKGVKIRVSKFKAKARYRRTIGFRALLTKVEIESIDSGTKIASSKVENKPVRKTSVKK